MPQISVFAFKQGKDTKMNTKLLIDPKEAVKMLSYTFVHDVKAAKDIKEAFYEEKSAEIAKAFNKPEEIDWYSLEMWACLFNAGRVQGIREERLRRRVGKKAAAEYEPERKPEELSAVSAEIKPAPVPLRHQMTDYKWQCGCLEDRLEHPEKYAPFEDVEKAVKRLVKWISEHRDSAVEENDDLESLEL